MIEVEKRDGSIVGFDSSKIFSAIYKAFDSLNMELRKDDILKATVSNVEVMGNENNIYFTLGGETIIARASKYDLKSIGEEIEFVIDSNRLHFFDIETEESILNYLNESETAI